MNGDQTPPSHGSRGHRPPRAEPGDLLRGLERLREALRERLDLLDRLVRDRLDARPEPAESASAREHALQQRIDALEERATRLVAESRRREHEVETARAQLDADRALLTDAWDRLERERIEAATTTAHAPRRPGAAAVVPEPASIPHPHPHPHAPETNPESHDVIAHAILKQFETLRDDVRRHGGGRRPRV